MTVDMDLANEDWLRTTTWDVTLPDGRLATTLDEAVTALGGDRAQVASDILRLPFGKAAPQALVSECLDYLAANPDSDGDADGSTPGEGEMESKAARVGGWWANQGGFSEALVVRDTTGRFVDRLGFRGVGAGSIGGLGGGKRPSGPPIKPRQMVRDEQPRRFDEIAPGDEIRYTAPNPGARPEVVRVAAVTPTAIALDNGNWITREVFPAANVIRTRQEVPGLTPYKPVRVPNTGQRMLQAAMLDDAIKGAERRLNDEGTGQYGFTQAAIRYRDAVRRGTEQDRRDWAEELISAHASITAKLKPAQQESVDEILRLVAPSDLLNRPDLPPGEAYADTLQVGDVVRAKRSDRRVRAVQVYDDGTVAVTTVKVDNEGYVPLNAKPVTTRVPANTIMQAQQHGGGPLAQAGVRITARGGAQYSGTGRNRTVLNDLQIPESGWEFRSVVDPKVTRVVTQRELDSGAFTLGGAPAPSPAGKPMLEFGDIAAGDKIRYTTLYGSDDKPQTATVTEVDGDLIVLDTGETIDRETFPAADVSKVEAERVTPGRASGGPPRPPVEQALSSDPVTGEPINIAAAVEAFDALTDGVTFPDDTLERARWALGSIEREVDKQRGTNVRLMGATLTRDQAEAFVSLLAAAQAGEVSNPDIIAELGRWRMAETGKESRDSREWGKPYTEGPAYFTPDGPVYMRRNGQRVRFYDSFGQQVGPEQRNVAPAAAYALDAGWVTPDVARARDDRSRPGTGPTHSAAYDASGGDDEFARWYQEKFKGAPFKPDPVDTMVDYYMETGKEARPGLGDHWYPEGNSEDTRAEALLAMHPPQPLPKWSERDPYQKAAYNDAYDLTGDADFAEWYTARYSGITPMPEPEYVTDRYSREAGREVLPSPGETPQSVSARRARTIPHWTAVADEKASMDAYRDAFPDIYQAAYDATGDQTFSAWVGAKYSRLDLLPPIEELMAEYNRLTGGNVTTRGEKSAPFPTEGKALRVGGWWAGQGGFRESLVVRDTSGRFVDRLGFQGVGEGSVGGIGGGKKPKKKPAGTVAEDVGDRPKPSRYERVEEPTEGQREAQHARLTEAHQAAMDALDPEDDAHAAFVIAASTYADQVQGLGDGSVDEWERQSAARDLVVNAEALTGLLPDQQKAVEDVLAAVAPSDLLNRPELPSRSVYADQLEPGDVIPGRGGKMRVVRVNVNDDGTVALRTEQAKPVPGLEREFRDTTLPADAILTNRQTAGEYWRENPTPAESARRERDRAWVSAARGEDPKPSVTAPDAPPLTPEQRRRALGDAIRGTMDPDNPPPLRSPSSLRSWLDEDPWAGVSDEDLDAEYQKLRAKYDGGAGIQRPGGKMKPKEFERYQEVMVERNRRGARAAEAARSAEKPTPEEFVSGAPGDFLDFAGPEGYKTGIAAYQAAVGSQNWDAADAIQTRLLAAHPPLGMDGSGTRKSDGKPYGSGYTRPEDPRNAEAPGLSDLERKVRRSYDQYVEDLNARLKQARKDKLDTASKHKTVPSLTKDGKPKVNPVTGKQEFDYTPERKAVHDEIIRRLRERYKDVPKNRRAIFLSGPSGAGKTTVLQAEGAKIGVEGAKDAKGNWAPTNYVVLNPDDIKEMLLDVGGMDPEWVERGFLPTETADLLHKESSDVNKIFRKMMLDEGYDVIFDGTLGDKGTEHEDGSWVPGWDVEQEKIDFASERGYRISGVLIDGTVDRSLAQAAKRHMVPSPTPGGPLVGRYVPADIIEDQALDGLDPRSGDGTSEKLGRPHRTYSSLNFEELAKKGEFPGGHVVFDNTVKSPTGGPSVVEDELHDFEGDPEYVPAEIDRLRILIEALPPGPDEDALRAQMLMLAANLAEATGGAPGAKSWEGLRVETKAGGADRNRGGAEKLRRYWTTGPGGARIAWGTSGDFTRCVANLREHLGGRAEGYCALRHREMNGIWPGDKNNKGYEQFVLPNWPGSLNFKADLPNTNPEPTGVMVALYPTDGVAASLAINGQVEPTDLHVTLAHLGDMADLDPEQLDTLKALVSGFAADTYEVEGVISGVGRFAAGPDDPGDPFYASVDAPELGPVRDDLVAALAEAGFEVSDEHGFTPHITLAYLEPDAEQPIPRLDPIGSAFPFLSLAIGSDVWDFPLAVDDGSEPDEAPPGEGEEP